MSPLWLPRRGAIESQNAGSAPPSEDLTLHDAIMGYGPIVYFRSVTPHPVGDATYGAKDWSLNEMHMKFWSPGGSDIATDSDSLIETNLVNPGMYFHDGRNLWSETSTMNFHVYATYPSAVCWFKADALPDEGWFDILKRGDNWGLEMLDYGVIRAFINTSSSGFHELFSYSYIEPGVTYCVALTYEEGRFALYINGVEEQNTYASGFMESVDGNFVLAAHAGAAQGFDGIIDEAVVYDFGLQSYDVYDIYQAATGIIFP